MYTLKLTTEFLFLLEEFKPGNKSAKAIRVDQN